MDKEFGKKEGSAETEHENQIKNRGEEKKSNEFYRLIEEFKGESGYYVKFFEVKEERPKDPQEPNIRPYRKGIHVIFCRPTGEFIEHKHFSFGKEEKAKKTYQEFVNRVKQWEKNKEFVAFWKKWQEERFKI